MIRSDEELEAALEAVAAWLENPPRPGSPQEECFNTLLGDIENYRPALAAEEAQAEPPERAELRRRVEELARHWEENHTTLMGVVGSAVRVSLGQHP